MKAWNKVREAKEEGKSDAEILRIGQGANKAGRNEVNYHQGLWKHIMGMQPLQVKIKI